MHITIDELAHKSKSELHNYVWGRLKFHSIADKSIEEDLRHFFGLDKIESSKITENSQNDNEWYRYASEIRLSDVKVDVNKLQNHNKKLTEDIQRSQKSIEALKEWVN